MIRSMTGYSQARDEGAGFSVSVSVKTTNHRFLDLQVRIAPGLEPLEPSLRRLIKEHVLRGHVEVNVGLEQGGRASLQIDRRLLGAYVTAYHELRGALGSASEPDLIALLRVPGMVTADNGAISAGQLEQVRQVVERVMSETLARLNEMRAQEGHALERELRSRLDRLRKLAEDVDRLSHQVVPLYQHRVRTRVHELLGGAEFEASRLAQEVAFLASRSDITEELTRLRSHLDQASLLLNEGAEVGKKFDFLFQEMNREANTALSKTSDVPEVGVEIGRLAIEMKTEIEKLREQVQNIE